MSRGIIFLLVKYHFYFRFIFFRFFFSFFRYNFVRDRGEFENIKCLDFSVLLSAKNIFRYVSKLYKQELTSHIRRDFSKNKLLYICIV